MLRSFQSLLLDLLGSLRAGRKKALYGNKVS
jgi:hypothetical protein